MVCFGLTIFCRYPRTTYQVCRHGNILLGASLVKSCEAVCKPCEASTMFGAKRPRAHESYSDHSVRLTSYSTLFHIRAVAIARLHRSDGLKSGHILPAHLLFVYSFLFSFFSPTLFHDFRPKALPWLPHTFPGTAQRPSPPLWAAMMAIKTAT